MMKWHEPRKTKVCVTCKGRYRSAFDDGLNCISCELGTYYVYAIQCQGFVKIGYTNDIHARVSTIRSSSPFDIKVLMKVRMKDRLAAKKAEGKLHMKMIKERHVREWFRWTPKTEKALLKAAKVMK